MLFGWSKPTGREKIIKKEVKNVFYSIQKIKDPSPSYTYLTIKCSATGDEISILKREVEVKKEIPIIAPIFVSALGIYGGHLLSKKGMVVLTHDIEILSITSWIGTLLFNNSQKSHKIWEKIKRRKQIHFIPDKPFTVKLQGTEYSSPALPDKEGILKINILQFAPFYKEHMPFYVDIFSPDGKNLGTFRVNTEPIAKSLIIAGKQKYPPHLSFSVSFDDSTGDRDFFLDAEEEGRIVLLVKNTGRGVARNLKVRFVPLNPLPKGLIIPTDTTINSIGVMKEKRVIVPLKGKRELETGIVKLKIEILEPYFQADAEPEILRFETRKFEPPNIVLHNKGVEEGEIVPRKSANISLIIQNQGKGRAEDTRCSIEVPPGITYLGDKREFYFGKMEPGEWKRIDFPIFVGARYKGDSVKITLQIEEKHKEFSKNINVSFPLNKPIARVKEIFVKGKEEEGKYAPPPVLTVDVDVNIPKTKMKNPNAVAVVIGNKRYEEEGVPDVEYAENDARIIKEYLIKALGFKEENIIFISNAKKSDFERIFGTKGDYKGQLYNYVKPNESDVFVYYTGHGAPDPQSKKAYIVPVDCHPDYVKLNGYSLDLFYENLSKIPARSITVVIDACFSGASEKGMLIASASPIGIKPIMGSAKGNINIFTSSSGEEISSWYPEKKHSLFTYFFLKGLQGKADNNQDKKLTSGELANYVKENVSYYARRLFNREQTPQFSGNRTKIIVDYKR